MMDRYAYVYRNGEDLRTAVKEVRALRNESYRNVADKTKEYNTNLLHVLELDSLLNTAELVLLSALAREESRGAHSRQDYPSRDDKNWLKHSLAYRVNGKPEFIYSPVTITKHVPTERRY